ncbi:MAG: type I restriction endonuclease subunit R, partial [Flavobacteriales bacterium]|nr:type I restriction endonuclease subunit R [Flavobacteriales bacterium]
KKLGGVECVQTLSRLNRDYPGKKASGTFVLDFFNDSDEILASFKPYYQVAELTDVSDPQMVYDLFEKLRAGVIFQWSEVEQFCTAFYQKGKSDKALSSICKPAVDRWSKRYESAVDAYKVSLKMMERTRKTSDAVLIGNAENALKECRQEKDALEIFKKDLGTFVRFYEFVSQIVPFDDLELEKLSLFARKLRPMLRETHVDEDEVDLDNVVLSHYRLSKLKQQDLKLNEDAEGYDLEPGEGAGSAKAKDPKEEFLSRIISRLNEIFLMDELTDKDLVNFAHTVADKVSENERAMMQLRTNTREQAMLGDFPRAVDDAVIGSNESQRNQMMQLLSNPEKAKDFSRLIYDLIAFGGAR